MNAARPLFRYAALMLLLTPTGALAQITLDVPIHIQSVHESVVRVGTACVVGSRLTAAQDDTGSHPWIDSDDRAGSGASSRTVESDESTFEHSIEVSLAAGRQGVQAIYYACELQFFFGASQRAWHCVPTTRHARTPCRIGAPIAEGGLDVLAGNDEDPYEFTYVTGRLDGGVD
jgi:hypothetical protein